ncbi:MAG: acyl-CoA dehydrogenase family protein [Sphingobium sp.]|nr:acyl-CoA dehydrogenase family protein [Sphingobium sp.]MCP5398207.1 acyl-CoA dehydrogenase family protein [Sphingomonas sp.]
MTPSGETFDIFLERVRNLVTDWLRPAEAQVEEQDEVPEHLVDRMRNLGLFGLSIPTEYGGLDFNMEQEARILFEMGRTSPSFRATFGTNVGIGSQGIILAGTDQQKAYWLPKIACGEILTSFALTEAEAGSDPGNVQTRAVREGDGYRLNGTKIYITNADKAELFTVMARTSDAPGARGISAFLVPRDLPGVRVGMPEKKMGQRGTAIADIHFEDALVPAANLLGEEGQGFKIAMRILDRSRLHIAALCVGISERLIADSVAHAANRHQFGKPLAEHQMIQAMIADCKTETLAARALVLETARQRDAGTDVTLESSAAKLFASEMVGRVADRAVQIYGGAGYVAGPGIERFYRDVRPLRIYEGTSQIQQIVIARETVKRGG